MHDVDVVVVDVAVRRFSIKGIVILMRNSCNVYFILFFMLLDFVRSFFYRAL